MPYNGWENYETWCVNLWLGNDEGLYNLTREYLPDEDDEDFNRDEAVENLADAICVFVNEIAPSVQGLFSDLLTHCLGRVNWREIAFSWIEDNI